MQLLQPDGGIGHAQLGLGGHRYLCGYGFCARFCRSEASGIGNFWQDLTRSSLYILLPIAFIYALVLVSQGVIQNFDPYTQITTLEGAKQLIAQGPVASQEAIKMLGTNGGGFFNANSAHPFENPNALSNLLQMLSIFIIPAALTYTCFGYLVKDVRQGFALLAVHVYSICQRRSFCTSYHFEAVRQSDHPCPQGVERLDDKNGRPGRQYGRQRNAFRSGRLQLFAAVTTDASCGAVNCMHDSLTPIGWNGHRP